VQNVVSGRDRGQTSWRRKEVHGENAPGKGDTKKAPATEKKDGYRWRGEKTGESEAQRKKKERQGKSKTDRHKKKHNNDQDAKSYTRGRNNKELDHFLGEKGKKRSVGQSPENKQGKGSVKRPKNNGNKERIRPLGK